MCCCYIHRICIGTVIYTALEGLPDAELKSKVNQKDNQFRTLVRRTHRHLSRTIKTQEGEDFADFKVAITLMPASLYGHHILLSSDDCSAIMNATSFDQIFIVLNQYWTFIQYELLEYVVQEYGNDDLKKEMKRYRADMEELEAQAGIDRLMAVKVCSTQPDSIAMEVDLSDSQYKLWNAHLMQQSVAEQCGLHPRTVHTLKADTGMYLPQVRKYINITLQSCRIISTTEQGCVN